MNPFWKITYWTLTILLGFVNPVFTFVLVILYYLPGILCNSETNPEQPSSSSFDKDSAHSYHQNYNKMKFFSKKTRDDLK